MPPEKQVEVLFGKKLQTPLGRFKQQDQDNAKLLSCTKFKLMTRQQKEKQNMTCDFKK